MKKHEFKQYFAITALFLLLGVAAVAAVVEFLAKWRLAFGSF